MYPPGWGPNIEPQQWHDPKAEKIDGLFRKLGLLHTQLAAVETRFELVRSQFSGLKVEVAEVEETLKRLSRLGEFR
jgi:hypothetical protein